MKGNKKDSQSGDELSDHEREFNFFFKYCLKSFNRQNKYFLFIDFYFKLFLFQF